MGQVKERKGLQTFEEVYREVGREAGGSHDIEGMEEITRQCIKRSHVTNKTRTMATTGVEQYKVKVSTVCQCQRSPDGWGVDDGGLRDKQEQQPLVKQGGKLEG